MAVPPVNWWLDSAPRRRSGMRHQCVAQGGPGPLETPAGFILEYKRGIIQLSDQQKKR